MKRKHKQNWEKPRCNLCNNRAYSVVFENASYWQHEGRFRIVKCSDCGLVFVHPRPTKSDIGQYYPKESYWGQDTNKAFVQSDWRNQRAKGYKFLYEHIKQLIPIGAVLDIGAGTGVFLSWFTENGWKVAGVELSKDAVRFARKVFKINLKHGDFLDFHFTKNSYDLVTLNNVLEHLHQPLQTLQEIYKVVKPNGLVLITVPNIESVGITLFGKTSHLLQPPRHLYHFSEETLTQMLQKAGFQVVNVDHGYWEHNYYSVFESFRLLFSPKFNQPSVDENIQLARKSNTHFSLVKELLKGITKVFTVAIVLLELFLRRSEVITVTAIKMAQLES